MTRGLLLGLGLSACRNPRETCDALDELGLDGSVAVEAGPAEEMPAFALGAEYMQLGLGQSYAEAGVRWAKTRLEVFAWGATEPRRPRGGEHEYNWSCTDAFVADWQQAGVVNLQSYLHPYNAWGSEGKRDYRPREKRRDDYRDWVTAIIERYDGDGEQDAPGLVRPVRHWVVGGEWTGFWPEDDADNYLDVLERTSEAARAASPEVKLGAIPLLLPDLFQGNEPSEAEIEAAAAETPFYRNSVDEALRILDRPDLFDYLDVHSLGDYTELPPMAAWLGARMAERGYTAPIWIDDAFPIGFLANDANWPAFYPVTEGDYDAVLDALLDVARGDEAATAWIRALCAHGTVHKTVTALGEGYAGVQLGNTEDWMPDEGENLRETQVRLIGASTAMGMVDVVHDGFDNSDVRQAGAPRAAWQNLALLASELDRLGLNGDVAPADFSAERLGGNTGARGYAFESDGQRLWVLWAEDGVLQLPGEDEDAVETTLNLPDGVEAVELTWGSVAGEAPEVQQVATPDGALELELDSRPVFVRPAG